MKAFVECWSPSTNTLLFLYGKLSISLWDLHKLGGLPIDGYLMDEVVPSTECLSSSLGKRERVSLFWFLLHVYHRLATSSSDRSVSLAEWIGYWSAFPRGYTGPSTAESSRADSSSLPCYPRGSIPAHGSHSTTCLQVFKCLEVPSSLVDEVYCAAFLSCWLCMFVLPLDVAGSVGPNVFMMASCMAAGKTVSLAIPVLANIYKGLHLITTACYPSNSGSCFPVHYLLGWMGTYLCVYSPMKKCPPGPHMVRFGGIAQRLPFSLLEAYPFLDECTPYWAAIRPSRPAPHVFIDYQLDSEEDMAFFLSLHTNMVGRPGPIIVSSSDVPAAVTKDVETATLAETVLSS
ncbi:hypothetical protein LIER_00792 [Lithospermum erythrorhizon]|uniref:Aminotransferase-like plant mobile domain-containing protein n=1 Tax=Lithospermum erythrorhizon TaxID=34254 RepID=A0AAV3NIN0_LITER